MLNMMRIKIGNRMKSRESGRIRRYRKGLVRINVRRSRLKRVKIF
jgi:hypothetical protein